MDSAYAGYAAFIGIVRYVVFGIAVVAAIVALVDWAVRTRRLQPFGAVARFCRRIIDPMMRPIENRMVRRGGNPVNAPWWTLVVVVVGGLVLITLLEFFGRLVLQVGWGLSSPGRLGVMVLSWIFMILRIALIVRVVSTWIQMSPYSPWIRWSYVMTEWMIAPVRKVLPPFGPVDASPLVVFLALWLVQSVLGIP
jgi:YggT family protein